MPVARSTESHPRNDEGDTGGLPTMAFRFMDLPAELRSMVYHELWMMERPLRTFYKGMCLTSIYDDKPLNEQSQGLPTWLLTNKHILAEAMAQHCLKARKTLWNTDVTTQMAITSMYRSFEAKKAATPSNSSVISYPSSRLLPSLAAATEIVIRKSQLDVFHQMFVDAEDGSFVELPPVHGFTLGDDYDKVETFLELMASGFPVNPHRFSVNQASDNQTSDNQTSVHQTSVHQTSVHQTSVNHSGINPHSSENTKSRSLTVELGIHLWRQAYYGYNHKSIRLQLGILKKFEVLALDRFTVNLVIYNPHQHEMSADSVAMNEIQEDVDALGFEIMGQNTVVDCEDIEIVERASTEERHRWDTLTFAYARGSTLE